MSADFESLKEKAKTFAETGSEEIKDRLSKLKDSPDAEALREAASEMAEEAAVFVRKYPLQSLLGGLAVGFLLGSMLSRKK